MNLQSILNIYRKSPKTERLKSLFTKSDNKKYTFKNLNGSSLSMVVASVFDAKNNHVLILNDKEEAAYFYNDLDKIIQDKVVYFFPSSYKRSIKYKQQDTGNIILRTEVLNQLQLHTGSIIVTYPEAIAEKVITLDSLSSKTILLKKGEQVDTKFIVEMLAEYGFEKVDFVYEPGQFSIRGSIVDIYSFSSDYPYRIDFFGDEVESIRDFEIDTQLSKSSYNAINIVPNIQNFGVENRVSFFECVPKNQFIWIEDALFTLDSISEIYNNTIFEDNAIKKQDFIIDRNLFLQNIEQKSVIEFGQKNFFKADEFLAFDISLQPTFNKKFDLLSKNLQEHSLLGYKNYILSDNSKQIERLQSIFEDISKEEVLFESIDETLHGGFIDHDLKICVYTDHQIFERYHKFELKTQNNNTAAINIRELNDLHPGDYVVHIDHGIGVFGGLEKIDVNGKMQECIRLIYSDKDVLFVNIHALHRISKYRGKDAETPKINKLGSGAWQKLKQTTKKKVKDIAKELIELYAKRKTEEGFQYSPDTYLQRELESSFIYEDTPDQIKATQAVKNAMETPFPMDLLVCGDVGFGKTEVAIRAAFKAVTDGKQVAIMVPTTVLAFQHYNTFKKRLKDFPCSIDYVSRMKSPTSIRESLRKLESGQLDIIIGTHRLASKDIKFKDLGLLIIDEEQKFGVSIKEKIRHFRSNIDTLTLTATPIPRTLQFSLMGARDLSIINTPPPNRHPILTELHTFDEEIIREAIMYEINRGGQVFFINNRIQNIKEIEALINRICPGIRTIIGHGQMQGEELENVMMSFINSEYDVLIATSIIESGLDIPNANTIIINNAQNFGLSDLHQLRGRVGRSNKKAFCYLLAPPVISLTQEARRRLKAIEQFSELGSGFNIAMQDLDIRGAGNMLGAEQSGFITDIGFETYQKILDEAIQELKENEFKDLFFKTTDDDDDFAENHIFVSDCVIDTDFELLFPDSYINNVSERIRLYRRLDNIATEDDLVAFEKELNDRFGVVPVQTIDLLNVVRLRWISVKLGIEKIILKQNKMISNFISNQQSPFYQSKKFNEIILFIQKNHNKIKLKESNFKLSMQIDNIVSIQDAIQMLNKVNAEK